MSTPGRGRGEARRPAANRPKPGPPASSRVPAEGPPSGSPAPAGQGTNTRQGGGQSVKGTHSTVTPGPGSRSTVTTSSSPAAGTAPPDESATTPAATAGRTDPARRHEAEDATGLPDDAATAAPAAPGHREQPAMPAAAEPVLTVAPQPVTPSVHDAAHAATGQAEPDATLAQAEALRIGTDQPRAGIGGTTAPIAKLDEPGRGTHAAAQASHRIAEGTRDPAARSEPISLAAAATEATPLTTTGTAAAATGATPAAATGTAAAAATGATPPATGAAAGVTTAATGSAQAARAEGTLAGATERHGDGGHTRGQAAAERRTQLAESAAEVAERATTAMGTLPARATEAFGVLRDRAAGTIGTLPDRVDQRQRYALAGAVLAVAAVAAALLRRRR